MSYVVYDVAGDQNQFACINHTAGLQAMHIMFALMWAGVLAFSLYKSYHAIRTFLHIYAPSSASLFLVDRRRENGTVRNLVGVLCAVVGAVLLAALGLMRAATHTQRIGQTKHATYLFTIGVHL